MRKSELKVHYASCILEYRKDNGDLKNLKKAQVTKHLREECFLGRLKARGKLVLLVTHDRQTIMQADRILFIDETTQEVRVYGSFEEYERELGDFELLCDAGVCTLESSKKPNVACAVAADSDFILKSPTILSESVSGSTHHETPRTIGEAAGDRPKPTKLPKNTEKYPEEKREASSVKCTTYCFYTHAMGGCLAIVLFLLALFTSESSTVAANAWVSKWSADSHIDDDEGLLFYFIISLLALGGCLFLILIRIVLGQKAARKLHMDCQDAVLRSKLHFLDVTPSGRIINRLSEDTVVLDDNLPMTLALNFQWLYRLLVIFAMAALINFWILLFMGPILVCFVQTQKYYLPSARELKRLDAVNKAPLFSQIAETLTGLTTIRAHNLTIPETRQIIAKLERQIRVFFLSNMVNRWLSLRMQLISVILVSATSFFAIYFRADLSKTVVGLAIMYSLKLTDTLSALNRVNADLETQMISVERMKQYSDEAFVPREASLERVLPPENLAGETRVVVEVDPGGDGEIDATDGKASSSSIAGRSTRASSQDGSSSFASSTVSGFGSEIVVVPSEQHTVDLDASTTSARSPANSLRSANDRNLKHQNWPSRGKIEFRNVSARYQAHLPSALNNISLTVPGRN